MTTGFVTSLWIGVVVMVICILIFFFGRRVEKHFFSPRLFEGQGRVMRGSGWLEWILPTLKFEEASLLKRKDGLDGAIYLCFLKYSAILFTVLSVMAFPILAPIYYQGKELPTERQNSLNNNSATKNSTTISFNDVDLITLSNLPLGSRSLWAPLVMTYVFTLCTWYYLFKVYNSYVVFMNVQKARDTQQTRTVMVRAIPQRFGTLQTFASFFYEYYGQDDIKSVVLTEDLRVAHELVKKREAIINAHRVAEDYLKENNQKRLQARKITGFWNFLEGVPLLGDIPLIGEKVDALEYYEKRIAELDDKIKEESAKDHAYSKCGFVTFASTARAMECAQTIHCEDPGEFTVRQAPDHRDIWWEYLVITEKERSGRKFITWALYVPLFLFWSIPVTLISAVSNLESLSEVGEFKNLVSFLRKYPDFYTLLNGFLPSLALQVFLALLPYIIMFLVRWRGWRVRREYYCEVLRVYFAFLVLNVFVVTTIAGSLFAVAEQLLKRPELITQLLANSLPKQSLFFINYVITQEFISYPVIWFLRVPDYIICKFKQFISKTKQEKHDAYKPDPPFEYHIHYARELLIFCIVLTYSVMCPLILPFGVVFFVFAYWSAKYNLLYVYTPPYEGVRMTHIANDCILAGIIIFQLTMTGVFSVQSFTPGVIGMFVLISATMCYRFYLGHRFFRLSKYLPLERCNKPYELPGWLKSQPDAKSKDLEMERDRDRERRDKEKSKRPNCSTVNCPNLEQRRKKDESLSEATRAHDYYHPASSDRLQRVFNPTLMEADISLTVEGGGGLDDYDQQFNSVMGDSGNKRNSRLDFD